MRADEAREIDALARARNRQEHADAHATVWYVRVASWLVLLAIAWRLYRWWPS